MVGKVKLAIDIDPQIMEEFDKETKARGMTKTFVIQGLMKSWSQSQKFNMMLTPVNPPVIRRRRKAC